MPKEYRTKILLDSSDPADTAAILKRNLTLHGQTTNPSLVAKSPAGQSCLSSKEKCTRSEVYRMYEQVVQDISSKISKGSISIEVYADSRTTAAQMIREGQKMTNWIPNAHIKLPITPAGLEAAAELVAQGINVNMTLCFSLEQAAAVYSATKRARNGQVYISPFIGRLDDIGQNGVSLVQNILNLYKKGDGHVQVLAASIRSLDHLRAILDIGADMVTAPINILSEFADSGFELPDDFIYDPQGTTDIAYIDCDLDAPRESFNIRHQLTTKGLQKFADDWNNLVGDTKKELTKKDDDDFDIMGKSGGINGLFGLGIMDS